MGVQTTIRGRYELKEVIGRGGMGIVYRAYDPIMDRFVAIKTLHDVSTKTHLDLFYRECAILRDLVHPNIVDILDMGDYEENGVTKPYFVMPLLPGKTLYDLLHPSEHVIEPLSVDRAVEIIAQTSRGLHAAHERELLHRDVKPRNIFIIDEYSVKLIDFGVAHLLNSESSTGIKGTLEYMAPEQLMMKPLSRRTDIFALATVCYEIITGTQPFRRKMESETATAVVNYQPPLACEINRSIPRSISQIIHKAMAKDPWSRFATAAEFAEALQRARRNEPLDHLFDANETRIRMERARQCYKRGEYQFASEILNELQAEGQLDTEVIELRQRVADDLLKQTTNSLFESAERYFGAEEYSLALRKLQELLQVDPQHAGALALRKQIERMYNERKVVELLHVAGERLHQAAFPEARKALHDALKILPEDTRVRQLLANVDSRQKEYLKQRQEQDRLYQASQAAWVQRDISKALYNLERLTELIQKTSEPRERIVEYKTFYDLVRGEHDALVAALEQARQKVDEDDLNGALALCSQFLSKYPRHAGFASLKGEAEKRQGEKQAAYRAEVERKLVEELDLDVQNTILEIAVEAYPNEEYYREQLRRVRDTRAEVNAIVEEAQAAEDAGDFSRALQHWSQLRLVYPRYQGLDQQIARLEQELERARAVVKAQWTENIETTLKRGNLDEAAKLLAAASAEFPDGFPDISGRIADARQRRALARRSLSDARGLAAAGQSPDAIQSFRAAYDSDPSDAPFRKSVLEAIVAEAESVVDSDWRIADAYAHAILELDSGHRVPDNLLRRIEDRKRAEFVGQALERASNWEKSGDFDRALQEIDAALSLYPRDSSLAGARSAVQLAQLESERRRERDRSLQHLRELAEYSQRIVEDQDVERTLDEVGSLAQRFAGDKEISDIAAHTGQQLTDLKSARARVVSGDLEDARAICERHLRDSPKHAGFLSVKQLIAEQERLIAVEYMDEVNRRLSMEPILENRVRVLEDALTRYPAELHYREELDLIREEQNLVHSIADQAVSLEKAGHFPDALDQWRRMQAIYRHYPDLDAQIARVARAHEQALEAARAEWTKQIQEALRSCKFAQATELARKADLAFPGEFEHFAQEAGQALERRAQAVRLISEAQDSAGSGQFAKACQQLGDAAAKAPGDSVVLKQAVEAHVKHARAALKVDWKSAAALVDQASSLDPSSKALPELRTKIDELKRLEVVQGALARAAELQRSKDLGGAKRELDAALETYPKEEKLLQRKELLAAEIREAAILEERKRSLEELRALEGATRTMVEPRQLARVLERAKEIAGRHRKDTEVNSVADHIREQVQTLQRCSELVQQGKLDEAERVADEILSHFPDHSAFAAVKREISDAREQAATAYLDEVGRKLSEEHDLERRERILREAVAQYPAESYYQQELDLVEQDRRLVDEIVSGARAAEAAGDHVQALEKWTSLGTVYRHYPNLESEIARVQGLINRARAAAREVAIAEIRSSLDERNLMRASDLIRRAEAKFGAELGEDRTQLRGRLEALLAAQLLLDSGCTLFEQGKYAEGTDRLRQAAGKIPAEAAAKRRIADELIRRSTEIVDSNWRDSEAILRAAAEIDRTHAGLAEASKAIENQKREEAVAAALARSGQLLDSGDLRRAEETVRAALAAYPSDARLGAQLKSVQSAFVEQQRRLRREQAFQELAAIERQAQAASLKPLRQLLKKIDPIRAQNAGDSEVNARAAVVTNFIAARIAELERPPVKPAPPPKAAQPGSVPGERTKQIEPRQFLRRKVLIGLVVVAILAAGTLLVVSRFFDTGKAGSVLIKSELSGATVSIGDKTCVTPACTLKLAAGTYNLKATKDGYKPIRQRVTVTSGKSELSVPLTFEPLPQILQVSTNFESGRVLLDGQFAGDLRGGQFVTSDVPPGAHTIRVTGGGADFRAEWRTAAGAVPELTAPMTARDVQATVVSNVGGTGLIACNCSTQHVEVDGSTAVNTTVAPGTAAPLQNLREGARRITIADRSLIVDVRPNPTLNVVLTLDRNVGTLVIEAGLDDVKVYLNNRRYQRPTEHGSLRIPVDVGAYTVRAEKDGYGPAPPQRVDVSKGEQKQVTFVLTPLQSTLEIAGAVPGAQVKVDGQPLGEVASNGNFRKAIPAGDHDVELYKSDYSPAHFKARFSAGQTIRPTGTQIAMPPVVKASAPPVPAPPDPAKIEAQDWERIRKSTSVDEIDTFVRNHPASPHGEEARKLAAQLRQQAAQANAARQEEAAWNTLDKRSRPALNDFLTRYGSGPNAPNARRLLEDLEKQDKEAAARLETDKRAKEQVDNARRAASADSDAIARTLTTYQLAFEGKDVRKLQAIWPSMPKQTLDSFRAAFGIARKIDLQLRVVGEPVINGATAIVAVERHLQELVPGGKVLKTDDKLRIAMARNGDTWVIVGISVQ